MDRGIIPGSHSSGRAPEDGESSWDGAPPLGVVAQAGDVLLLRCDTWRVDTPQVRTSNQTRHHVTGFRPKLRI
eukprot:COSAG04_NODE_2507_length_3994_cov_3.489859_3_plen_73_part_00